jgi:hypothetical protein
VQFFIKSAESRDKGRVRRRRIRVKDAKDRGIYKGDAAQ